MDLDHTAQPPAEQLAAAPSAPSTTTTPSTTVEPPTRTPRTHVDSTPLPTDSMVTVPLSEAGGNTPDDDDDDEQQEEQKETEQEKDKVDDDDKDGQDSVLQPEIIIEDQHLSSRPTSSEIHKAFGRRDSQASIIPAALPSPTVSVHDVDADTPTRSRRSSSSGSAKSAQVDWAELERKETQQSNQQPSGEGQDNVCIPAPAPDLQLANMCRPWHCCLPALSRRTTPSCPTQRPA